MAEKGRALMKLAALYLSGFLLIIYFNSPPCAAQAMIACEDSLCFIQIGSDSIFGRPQRISLLVLDKDLVPGYDIDFAYQTSTLLKTSQFAENYGAVAAVNGSFFDMDTGGSVCYFEKDDSVISRTRDPEFKWGVSDSIINGAILLDSDYTISIEYAKNELIYECSAGEAFVMISGPVLIQDSTAQKLPDMKFANNRHPRTCVGITRESIIFVTIDGRSEQAAGMNLHEVQRYLLELGCLDAINLDGGGSTSMWFKDMGIVNNPSDNSGERSVANALLILKK